MFRLGWIWPRGLVIFLVFISMMYFNQKKALETSQSDSEQKVQISQPLQEKGLVDKEIQKAYTLFQEELRIKKTNRYTRNFVIKEAEIDQQALELIKYDVQKSEDSAGRVDISSPSEYSLLKGVTCFRGNNYRDDSTYGFVGVEVEGLEKIWEKSIGSLDQWTGVGWNGQPSIVEWPEHIRKKMNILEKKRTKEGLKEVLYAALDGKVYFLDLEDGNETRSSIQLPGPIKGSLTVDPRGIPLLYVGQGINIVHGKRVAVGYRLFSLLNQKQLYFINGIDDFAYRGWPAFDSTALIDRGSDTMIIGGENGLLYKVKLNTDYDPIGASVDVNPIIDKYRYTIKGNPYQGIENSVAIHRNLVYFADNGGWLQCVDIDEMKPKWIRDVTDDTDSTIVLEEENKRDLSLFTACEVDKQGKKGYTYIRKIDGLSGELIWEKAYSCHSIIGTKPNNGGVLATPVLGKYDLEDRVIYNIARYGGLNKGLLVALNKKNGEEIWRQEIEHYSWSSPVAIYTKSGKGYVILCDSGGNMFLIDGKSGKTLDRINLGSNVEGSPAVFEDMLVVGTRGQKIVGVKIK